MARFSVDHLTTANPNAMPQELDDNTDCTEVPETPKPSSGGFLRRLLGLLQDAAVYGMGGVLGQLANFLLLPLYLQFLTKADYGVLGMLAVVNVVFQPLAQVGMRAATFRFFSLANTPDERREVLTTGALSIFLTTTTLLVLGLLGTRYIALAIGNVAPVDLIRLTLLASACSALAEAPYAVLRAARRVKMAASFNLFSLLLSICASILFVVVLQWGVKGAVLGTLVGESVTAVALYIATRTSFGANLNFSRWRNMLLWGAPFVPHHLQAAGIEQLGIYLTGTMLGAGETGAYNIALKLSVPLSFTVNTIQKGWVAYKYHIYSAEPEPKQVFRSIVTYYFAGICYLWVGIALWGPELLRVMTPIEFHEAGPLIAAVAAVNLGRGMYFMLGTGLEFSENTRYAPLISLVGLITTAVAAFTLTHYYGAMGAAVGTSIGWAAMTAMHYYVSWRLFPIRYDWGALLMLGCAAGAFVAAGYFMQALLPIPRIAADVILSLAFPAVALAILARSESERQRILYLVQQARQAIG
ncbi:MAG TPA: lipopolysaccharide biosynthesis protein [Pirellulales bacterium]|nr:lipopolysaccharide biosynthesis protein [Pirellulales bacterium]